MSLRALKVVARTSVRTGHPHLEKTSLSSCSVTWDPRLATKRVEQGGLAAWLVGPAVVEGVRKGGGIPAAWREAKWWLKTGACENQRETTGRKKCETPNKERYNHDTSFSLCHTWCSEVVLKRKERKERLWRRENDSLAQIGLPLGREKNKSDWTIVVAMYSANRRANNGDYSRQENERQENLYERQENQRICHLRWGSRGRTGREDEGTRRIKRKQGSGRWPRSPICLPTWRAAGFRIGWWARGFPEAVRSAMEYKAGWAAAPAACHKSAADG